MQVLAGLWPEVWGTPAAPTPSPGTAGQPHPGQGPFGLVPGATELPDPYADLKKVIPDLDQLNTALGANIYSKLKGELPQDVQNLIRDKAAAAAVGGGMPGAGLYGNRTARDLGLTSLDLTKQGVSEYNATIPTIKSTQTVSPETEIALSQSNAILAAAPDPAAGASASMDIFNRYLNSLANRTTKGGYGPSGSSGSYLNPNATTTRPGTDDTSKAAEDAAERARRQQELDDWNRAMGNINDQLDWEWYIGGQGLPTSPAGGTGDFSLTPSDYAAYYDEYQGY